MPGCASTPNRLPDPDRRALPLCRDSGSASRYSIACLVARNVCSPTSTPLTGAAACRRTAALTTSPTGDGLAFRSMRAERDERFAGRNGDPRLLRPVLLGEPVADRQRCAHGSLGIVLVDYRRTEKRHHGLADELLDAAAEALDLRAQVRVVGHERCANVLGVEPLGARREVDEVSEEDGDDLPLLAPRSCALPAAEGGVLAEYPSVELLQLLARRDAQLLVERPPCLTVRRQRFRLPPGAVEREHELGAQVLVERMLDDQRLELRDQLAGAAEGKVGVEAVLHRLQPQLVQPGDLRRNGVLVQDVLERPPAPEGECSSERLTRPCGLVLEHNARGACEALEARCIELVEIDPERVARRTRDQYPARVILRSAGPENSSQLRDVEPELPAGFWRVVGPEHVEEPVRRDDLVRVHQ